MLLVLETLICAVTHVGSNDTQPFFPRVKCLLGDALTIHAISKTKPKEKGNAGKLRNILFRANLNYFYGHDFCFS